MLKAFLQSTRSFVEEYLYFIAEWTLNKARSRVG